MLNDAIMKVVVFPLQHGVELDEILMITGFKREKL
jgi:hypothetical protein